MSYQTKKGGVKGVKIKQMASFKKPRTYPGVGSGRSGPPMVDVGSKSGSANSLKAAPNTKFARMGSVSERKGHTGPESIPTIGGQKGHGDWASMGIRRSK
jgi:hypothetical protein